MRPAPVLQHTHTRTHTHTHTCTHTHAHTHAHTPTHTANGRSPECETWPCDSYGSRECLDAGPGDALVICSAQHVGYYSPDQGSNLCPSRRKSRVLSTIPLEKPSADDFFESDSRNSEGNKSGNQQVGQHQTRELLCSNGGSAQSLSRVGLHDPTNRSTPGLPVHHQLLESTQTHVH